MAGILVCLELTSACAMNRKRYNLFKKQQCKIKNEIGVVGVLTDS